MMDESTESTECTESTEITESTESTESTEGIDFFYNLKKKIFFLLFLPLLTVFDHCFFLLPF